MITSIKITNGKDLDVLLDHPEELAALIKFATGKGNGVSADLTTSLIEKEYLTTKGVNPGLISVNIKKTKADIIGNLSLTAMQRTTVPKNELKYYDIALAFYHLIKSNLVNLGARISHLNGATYKKWVTPIRLLIEQDKVTEGELREVWKFLKGHQFWSTNIQSTEKLRKQFPTLYSQLKANEKREKSTTDNKGSRTVSADFIGGIFEDLQS